jgi:alkyldihydroxyacetonephosphate synthase
VSAHEPADIDSALPARLAAIVGARHVSTAAADRLAYARDVFPPALVAMRAGGPGHPPDLVVRPGRAEEVAGVLRLASELRVPVVPYGGGSGIAGAALAIRGGIVLDTKRLDRVLDIDETSLTVRVQAGVIGAHLEEALNAKGLTLGHSPQSMRSSTVGGWIACRAAGVHSTRYGKIEDMVLALEAVLATGEIIRTLDAPRSSTGPDLDQLILGSEGTLAVVTEATLAIHELPPHRAYDGFLLDSLEAGLEAVRLVMRRGLRPPIVRLYDAEEGAHLLERAGTEPGPAALIVESVGTEDEVARELELIARICADQGARRVGGGLGRIWESRRFDTTGLLTAMREGGIADALEVAAPWRRLGPLYRAMRARMAVVAGPEGLVLGHLSHAYPTGGNLYMIFRMGDPDGYSRMLEAAFAACRDHGGSISHHHGIGLGKARWMAQEHGQAGLEALGRIKHALDPAGILNPGKLWLNPGKPGL